jgi:ornithine cyclodeaminase/alanine dehydrogenase-like protein (mu-crystallin family)
VAVYVTEEQVRELLTPAEAIAAVEASFDRLARGVVDNPSRVRAAIPGGVFAVMPCVDRELGYAGLKSYAWLTNGTPFVVVLFSLEHARLEAVVEADYLGQLRTAAASAVAARRLAPEGATSLGIVGCGRQAATHVAALRDALPSLERVVVYCRDPERRAAFCAANACEEADDPREPSGCDIVVSVTTATEPVVFGDALPDDATVIGVGANDPGQRELDGAVLQRAALVCCDSIEQSKLEAGDLVGRVDWREVRELQDVRARESEGVVVFKSNGLAAWDLAVAARVLELV